MKNGSPQPGILAASPTLGRSMTFRIEPESDVRSAMTSLRDGFLPDWGVAGLGEPAVLALRRDVPGLRAFPALSGAGIAIPSTQQALWVFLRGENRGALFDLSENVRALLSPAFALDDAMDTFTYAGGRDLSGFEDGTENPAGSEAVNAAIVAEGPGLAGSSFVAVQRWAHDLQRFRTFPPEKRDHTIGRELESNDEIEDAPPSAHVKRTAQESFDPPAFMVRRSMPWATADGQGLEFIAFVESLDRFERQMRRMAGLDDGVTDALFTFSRPLTGGYYWCPPIAGGRLDLSYLRI